MSNIDESPGDSLAEALDKQQRGRRALEAGSLESAVSAFTESIKLAPMEDTYRLRGASLNRLGRAQQGQADLQKANEFLRARKEQASARALGPLFWTAFAVVLVPFVVEPVFLGRANIDTPSAYDSRAALFAVAIVGTAVFAAIAGAALWRFLPTIRRVGQGILAAGGAGLLVGTGVSGGILVLGPERPVEHVMFESADAASGDQFGAYVAISGDSILVGAPENNDAGSNSGSAYVFVRSRNTWTQQAKLGDGAADLGDQFGRSVAIDGNTAVVGIPLDDDVIGASGSMQVFVRNGTVWSHQAKLLPADLDPADNFGNSLDIDGDTIVAGSIGNNAKDVNSGSAYIFVRTGTEWTEQGKLTARDGIAQDALGTSVAISVDTVIAGAPRDDDNGSNSGSVYIFTRTADGWAQQAKLVAGDGAAEDDFGESVAISGDIALVGAPEHDAYGTNAGAVYVFFREASAWTQRTKLIGSDSEPGDSFGWSVDIEGNSIIVGARWNDKKGDDAGAAYVFVLEGSDWTQKAKLTANDAAPGDSLGFAVGVSNDSVVLGAPHRDGAGASSGSVYVYDGPGQWLPE